MLDFKLVLIFPEILLTVSALLVIIISLILNQDKNKFIAYFSLGGIYLTIIATISLSDLQYFSFYETYTLDSFSVFLKLLALISTALVIISAIDYIEIKENKNEFYSLLLLSTVGIMFLISASDLIILYLCFEFVSISSYILAGFIRKNAKSAEAAIKYFLLGAVTSCFMLYGMSLIYGICGTTNLYQIADALAKPEINISLSHPIFVIAIVILLAGLGFKIAAVPFHQWSPDTYEGAPTPIAAYISVAPKLAGFAIILRIFYVSLPAAKNEWVIFLVLISILSMTLGNLVAIAQKNIKRLLAYSSIAHAGYILIGVVAIAKENLGISSVLIYLLTYLFMNIGAFTIAIIISMHTGSDDISAYTGLSQRAPFLSLCFTIFLLSLLGLPPLAGFIGKLFVFAAAIQANLYWLAVIGIINSVVSAYYYVGIIRTMYLLPPKDTTFIKEIPSLGVVVIICFLAILFIGIYPAPFLKLAFLSQTILGF